MLESSSLIISRVKMIQHYIKAFFAKFLLLIPLLFSNSLIQATDFIRPPNGAEYEITMIDPVVHSSSLSKLAQAYEVGGSKLAAESILQWIAAQHR